MNSDSLRDLDIAVVGMAGRFPGAPSVEAFWRNLRAGVESIRDLSDDELRGAGVEEATITDPRFVRRAADLKDADRFDAGLFGFTPREAELMDPQFRVFLEDAWAALEDAGYLSDGHELRVGVFAGASGNTYLLNNVYSDPRAAESVGAFQTSIGNERDYLATHVSYRLDLRGPSLVVQTACSTSLVAVHLACQSLLGRECDVALAGGVSISVPQMSGYLYEDGGIASPDGRCRAFDEAAAGCVKGNGSGVVVLRRLEDALRDGDTIRAVIKGSAVNNDGAAKVGFTAPSDEGQSGVISEALAAAGVDPATITYVEAHGTATALGDPVEVAALARAFGPRNSPPPRTGTTDPSPVCAETSTASPERAGNSNAGPTPAGTPHTGPARAGTSSLGPAPAGPSNAGPTPAETSHAGPARAPKSSAGLAGAANSSAGPPRAARSSAGPPRADSSQYPGAAAASGRSVRCALGSVKTNVGHLDAAAGVAGLIKTVLALEHGEIPPSLHFERANPRIDFATAPFYVNAELREWPRGDAPRRAGVSSFGIGGTNAHLIVEEAPDPLPPGTERPAQLLVLSAATEQALADGSEALAARLGQVGAPGLADAAYTLQVGRKRLPWRRAVLAKDAQEAIAALRSSARRGAAQRDERRGADVAFLFPGQGAQHAGMSLGLYREEPVFRDVIDRCVELLLRPLGLDLREVVFAGGPAAIHRDADHERGLDTRAQSTEPRDGPGDRPTDSPRAAPRAGPRDAELSGRAGAISNVTARVEQVPGVSVVVGAVADVASRSGADERLQETSLTQPSLFAVEYALARLWISWGVRPVAMAGHSIGEYVAACVSGVMSLEDALALVAERGRLMGTMPRGAMLAVQLGEADLAARLTHYPALSLAAVNGRSSCVASGPGAEIERLEADLGVSGVAHHRLHTSHAFHSAMMDPIVSAFEERVRRVRLAAPSVPFLSNLTGTWITAEQATDPSYWARHLRGTVRLAENLAELATDPARIQLEVGPGTSLASLARLHAGPQARVVASLRHRKGAGEDDVATLEALGQLWCAGVDVDWAAFHKGFGRRRVPLPTYAFERRRYWIEPAAGGEDKRESSSSLKNPDVAEWFYVPGWKRSLGRPAGERTISEIGDAARNDPAWLVFDDGSKLARALIELAGSRGAHVAIVRAGKEFVRGDGSAFEIDPRRRDHYDQLVRGLRSGGLLPGRIAHFWSADGSRLDPGSAQDLGFFSLLYLTQSIGHVTGGGEVRIAAVANGLFDIAGEAVLCPERATLAGPCRVIPQEYPGVTCRLVDVSGSNLAGRAVAGAYGAEVVVARANAEAAAGAGASVADVVVAGAIVPGMAVAGAEAAGIGLTSADTAEAARCIATELETEDREPVVVWRGGYRWIPSYERVRLGPVLGEPDTVRAGGAYVLTGGTEPFELALAKRLGGAGARGIAFLECEGEDGPGVAELRAEGLEVLCSNARVTDPGALAGALGEARRTFGRLDAVFHTACPIGGGMIQLKDRGAAERVLAPRLGGARALAGLLGDGERLVLFSSAISTTGVFGQVDFCAASAFLDAFAHARRRAGGPRVLTIDWGTAHWDRWQSASGAGAEALLEQLREIQSAVGITVEEGIDALWRALALGEPQVVVSTQDLDELVAQSTSASVAEFLEGVGRPAAPAGDRAGRALVALASDTERKVAAVWSALLGIAPIGRTDNFFELGGNSLLAIQLASHLRRAFDIDLSIGSLFESADLASLAAAVDAASGERHEAEEVARLLEEIEGLTEAELRAELARNGDAGRTGEAEPAA